MFISTLFKVYVKQNLQTKIAYASVQFPQGNGINESTHRISKTLIKTRHIRVFNTTEDIVVDAVLAHDITPS